MNSLYQQFNVNEDGEIFSIKIDEEIKQINPLNGSLQLEQIPDSIFRVNINVNNLELFEVFDKKQVNMKSFYVDYNIGKVHFSKENYGKFANCNYYGIGVELIHANRIFCNNKNGVVEMLEELIENINNAVTTSGVLKENYKTTILANQLVYNSDSEFFEYTLKHNLNSNKINIGVYDINEEPCLNICKQIDANTLKVRNDKREDLKIVINYGSIS